MPAVVQKFEIQVGGKDAGAGETFKSVTAHAEGLASKLRLLHQEANAEGEGTVERILKNPEKLVSLLSGEGLKLGMTAIAFHQLEGMADGLNEHLEALHKGAEGIGDAFMSIAASVPILGEAVKAGMGLGKLTRSLFGLEDPEELLKEAQEKERWHAERTAKLNEGFDRDRLDSLEGFAKRREQVEQDYKRKQAENSASRKVDLGKANEEIEKDQKGLEGIRWNLQNVPGWASHHRDEMAKLPELEKGEASVQKKRSFATKPFDLEEQRLQREKEKELTEINRQEAELRLNVANEGRERLLVAQDHAQEESLRRVGLFYAAERIQLLREYEKSIEEIDKRLEEQKRENPALATEFERSASYQRQAAGLELEQALRRAQLDQQKEDAHKKLDALKGEQDAESELRVESLRLQERDTEAEREILHHARANADAAAKGKYEDGLRGLGFTKAEMEERSRLSKEYIDTLRRDQAVEGSGLAKLDKGVADHRRSLDERMARMGIDSLHDLGAGGNGTAELAAKRAEVEQLFRLKGMEYDDVLKDDSASPEQKGQAKLLMNTLEARKKLALENLLPQARDGATANLEGSHGISGAAAASRERRTSDNIAKHTADTAKAVAEALKLLAHLPAIANALSNVPSPRF